MCAFFFITSGTVFGVCTYGGDNFVYINTVEKVCKIKECHFKNNVILYIEGYWKIQIYILCE